jgi:hypothetical protein
MSKKVSRQVVKDIRRICLAAQVPKVAARLAIEQATPPIKPIKALSRVTISSGILVKYVTSVTVPLSIGEYGKAFRPCIFACR